MRRSPTLKDVQRHVRAQICAHCPSRTQGADADGEKQRARVRKTVPCSFDFLCWQRPLGKLIPS